ncbi:MAG TPA: ATP-binding cassette domain-containing protein [Candidatus Izemoplasmatales bacterium]|nr:ATP-binding cassette domain-containing protein [Candidatus Izemoplasmatales bacterium]
MMNKIKTYITQFIKKTKINVYDILLKYHESKRAFKKDLIDIKTDELNLKKKKKIDRVQLKYLHHLSMYESRAGIVSDYIQKKIDERVSKIKHQYYWKNRIINQKIKRAKTEELKEKLTIRKHGLEKEKQEKIREVKKTLINPQPSEMDKQLYAEKKAVLEKNKNETTSLIREKTSQRVTEMKEKTEKEIQNHQDKVDTYTQRIVTLEKTLKHREDTLVLDEGVALSLRHLSMHFGGLKAVDELSFDVKKGEIFGLIGPNGAGKTTVFNCITRFYKPTSGDMYFRNANKKTIHLNEVAVHNIIKEGIVRTFQNVELVWELNILDNLLVAAHSIYRSSFFGHSVHSRLTKREETVYTKRAMKILKDLDLTPYTYAFPIGLPYGVLKKVELARTLMSHPKLIILDEPAAGLNDSETRALAEVIKKIKKEYDVTVFLVEHDMGLVMSICDTVCAISFGKKLAMGTPKEIQNSKVVQEAYLGGD